MADKTGIEWTDATWNPVRGCSLVSPGCTNCYAMKQAHRFSGPGKPYAGLTKMTKGGPVWTGEIRKVPEAISQPVRWKRPRRIFVNSMSDVFHEGLSNFDIGMIFETMIEADWHTYQVLTKRPARMLEAVKGMCRQWGLANLPRHIWLGVSVEDQARADERIPLLLQTPAAVRWISAEPLIGPVDLTAINAPGKDECYTAHHGRGRLNALTGWCYNESLFDGRWEDNLDPSQEGHHGNAPRQRNAIDWVVVGGESGPGARPFAIEWARLLVRQCKAGGVPLFMKQVGADFGHCGPDGVSASIIRYPLRDRKGGDPAEWPADLRVREFPSQCGDRVR